MPNWDIIWDLDDDPLGNVAHIDEHGVTKDEVAEVLRDPLTIDVSRSSGNPIAFGITSSGRSLAVLFEQVDDDRVYPLTAYDVEF
ncbi:MAG: hypothetical protein L0211_24735 [Planctomycetaceae bacterium]|nr:hypothetical protein [Planctomycetaceae bacterium]